MLEDSGRHQCTYGLCWVHLWRLPSSRVWSVSHISFVELVFDCKAAPFLGCCVHLGVLGTQVAVLHRAHTSGFCSASQQLFSAQRGIAVALGRCVLRHQAWHLVSLGTLVECQAPWANRVAERMTGERRTTAGRSATTPASTRCRQTWLCGHDKQNIVDPDKGTRPPSPSVGTVTCRQVGIINSPAQTQAR
jgi:hypothetical protein